jgi:hypothetical protein
VRVVQIADSPLAPLFEVLERPNGWDRQLQEVARESSELSELGAFRKAFWSHFVARHPASATYGPASADSVRWRPADGTGTVVVQYLAQQNVGVFVRGPRGAAGEGVEDEIRPVAGVLEKRLGVPMSGSRNGGLFNQTFRIDSRSEANWDAMSDWLVSKADEYEAALVDAMRAAN